MSDAAGLFAPAADVESVAGSSAAPKGPRTQLTAIDTVASQVFNPWGASVFEKMNLSEVWQASSKGNKWTKYFTEFAAEEGPTREFKRGVAISRLAEIILEAIHKIQTSEIKDVIKPELLSKVNAEANALKPALIILNAGKGSHKAADAPVSFASAKKRHRDGAPVVKNHSHEDIEGSAKAVYAWLKKEASPLRAVLHILSGAGVYYAANVQEKVARSWIETNAISESDVVRAVLARQAASSSSAASSAAPAGNDAQGLLD